MNAVGSNQKVSVEVAAIRQMQNGTACGVLKASGPGIRVNAIWPGTRDKSLVQHHLQRPPMDRVLRPGVTRLKAARLFPYGLAELCIKS